MSREASSAVWQVVSNYASLSGTNQTNIGYLFLPKTAETFTYDADGNLTSDGRWTNTWDGENRLIDMTGHSSGPSSSRKSIQFAYDSQGRRYSKIVSNWTGSAWTRALHEKLLYDGWNLLGVLNGTNNTILKSFLWGFDLSGSLQGAGGVGGLIAFANSQSLVGTHFVAYDGNGNVLALVAGDTGSPSARYEYDPFGRTIRASGTVASLNSARFSSKQVDEESDLAYYGYRYLDPITGRWLSRDPIEESGGLNMYALLEGDLAGEIDLLGLCKLSSGGGGIRYRVLISSLDRFYKPKTPYQDLAKSSVANLVSRWSQKGLTMSFPTPKASGPFSGRSSKEAFGAPRGNFIAWNYLLFVDWEVDDPAGTCKVTYEEDVKTEADDGGAGEDYHDAGDGKFVTARRTSFQLPNCTHTVIYADAPGSMAIKKAYPPGVPRAYGVTHTVHQTTKLEDTTTGDVVDSVDWTVVIKIDKSGKLILATP